MSDHDDKTVIAEIGNLIDVKPKTKGAACLVQYNGASAGKRYPLDGASMKIGRSANNEITINENSVSRTHALISPRGEIVDIEDAGSANGTYVNDKKIEGKYTLKDQDMIGLGTVLLKFFAHNNMDGFIQDKIYRMATIDAGTQIFNKQYLLDALTSEVNGAKSTGRPLSIVYFDLDHFKKVNDTHGHNAGDQVLRETADIVKKTVRKDDIFARFGGEEFVVVAPRTELQPAFDLAEQIRKAVEAHVFILEYEKDGQKVKINHKQTVSLGVAQLGPNMSVPKELLEAADKKLYTSKQSGRNKVTF